MTPIDKKRIDAVLADASPDAPTNGPEPKHAAGLTTYEVSREGRAWRIKLAGDGFTEWAMTKEDAVARARILASRAPNGTVVVLDRKADAETVPSGESKPS